MQNCAKIYPVVYKELKVGSKLMNYNNKIILHVSKKLNDIIFYNHNTFESVILSTFAFDTNYFLL